MDKLFLPTMRARNLFAPDRCSVHLPILSRAGLWLWATTTPSNGPGTIEEFRELWRRQVTTETGKYNRAEEQGQLFK